MEEGTTFIELMLLESPCGEVAVHVFVSSWLRRMPVRKLICLCVLLFAAPCCGSSLFSFDGEFRDGTPITGELTLAPDTIVLEIRPAGGGSGVIGTYSNADFVRFTVFDDDIDSITLEDFDGPVGGTITLVGDLFPTEGEPTIDSGLLAIWDDGIGFSSSAKVTSWKTLPVPSPSSLAAGLVSLVIFVGAYSIRRE